MKVQPRVSTAGEGVSSSDLAFELADMVMERIILSIDPYECNPNHLKVILKTNEQLDASIELYNFRKS